MIILGYGKLAKDLAEYFKPLGHSIWATKRQKQSLKNAPYIDQLFPWHLGDPLPQELAQKAKSSEPLIICLPPLSPPETLEKGLMTLLKMHPFLKEKTIFYTNSISLYGENQGDVDEETTPQPEKERGKELHQLEERFLKEGANFYSLRLGGLFSKDRHPVYFLSGKENLTGAKAYLNGVDHRDVARAIDFILDKKVLSSRINIVWDQHPFKSDFYVCAASKRDLPPPRYSEERESAFKRVHSKVLKEHGFVFKYSLTDELS